MRHDCNPALTAIAAAVAMLAGGCATPSAPSRPALISHVVLIKLKNPAEAPELIADSDAKLAKIPGVVSYVSGPPLDTGRSNVDGQYDVGLYIGFDSTDAYKRYVDDPRHVEAITKWKPRWESIRIFDIVDDHP